MSLQVEITDTFGGEANYGFVQRMEFRYHGKDSVCAIVKAVKREAGLDGRHVTDCYGDTIRIYFPDSNIVAFVDIVAE